MVSLVRIPAISTGHLMPYRRSKDARSRFYFALGFSCLSLIVNISARLYDSVAVSQVLAEPVATHSVTSTDASAN